MTCAQLKIVIGCDSREPAAFSVLAHSILSRASKPISILPLTRQSVSHLYRRARGPLESTEFSMTRFLTPYLCGFDGWALFMDCDMLCLSDIWDVMLYPLADPGRAVYVCQHDYSPLSSVKFLNQTQTAYPRKNWSSFMLFDCRQCHALTPEYVNTATGLELHRFQWLGPDDLTRIGPIPLSWNWLVGEYPHNPDADVLHYTLGTPCLPGYERCDHSDLWHLEADRMMGKVAV